MRQERIVNILQEVHIRVVTGSAVRTSGSQHVAVRPGNPTPRRTGRWVAGSAGAGRLGGGPRVGLSEASRGARCPSRQLATSGDACVEFGPEAAHVGISPAILG